MCLLPLWQTLNQQLGLLMNTSSSDHQETVVVETREETRTNESDKTTTSKSWKQTDQLETIEQRVEKQDQESEASLQTSRKQGTGTKCKWLRHRTKKAELEAIHFRYIFWNGQRQGPMDQLEFKHHQCPAISRSDNRWVTGEKRNGQSPGHVAGHVCVLMHRPGPAQTLAGNEMMSPTEIARGLAEET